MLELTDWFRDRAFPAKPWLVLGKGPTFDRRREFDLGKYNLLALNHVIDELKVDVAHIIDIDVVGDCSAALARNCDWLLMPRYPHVRSTHGDRALEGWFDEFPVLREIDSRGRLVWYNLATGTPEPESLVIAAGNFSSEVVIGILARMGVKTIRSLGIDGGRSYASAFRHLERSTLLANDVPAFDLQFDRLQVIAEEHGLDYRPLVEALRIFVGTDETQIVAHRVLEYSIRKSASVPVEVTPMLGLEHRMPRRPEDRPRTGFSFNRFMIPELCGYRGRALYLDADMLVLGDVAELADMPFGPCKVLRTDPEAPTDEWGRYGTTYTDAGAAVMLLDCERLPWKIDDIVAGLDEGRYTYEALMSLEALIDPDDVVSAIPPEWNALERYESGRTKLLHYTVVPSQPWKNDDNPLGEFWMQWYREGVENGAVPPDEVELQISAGHVKESLRPALRLAPSRRSILTNASLEHETAQMQMRQQIAALESRIVAMERSTSWRIGSAVVRTLRAPASIFRRSR
jgi:hypothetical protein